MTTPKIKSEIAEAMKLADQLRSMVYQLHKSTCSEMSDKEKQGKPLTEERLMSETILPMISDATQLTGKLAMLNNIYNE
ncbi:hypothetical protein D2H34_004561 [Vibrio fluvialis]